MTEEKRHAIENRYIIRQYNTDPKNMSEELKIANHYEFNKYQDTIHLYSFMGPKSKNEFKVCSCGFGNIGSDMVLSIYHRQKELDNARIDAREALDLYLEDKQNLKNHITDWTSRETRRRLQFHKKIWIEASNHVKLCKRSLWYSQLLYSRFLEWYSATNKKIKELESLVAKN